MVKLTETGHPAEAVIFEEERDYSRDKVTVLSGEDLKANAVIAKLAASGKYVEWDAAQSAEADGSTTAAGVLIAAVDATAADKDGVAIVRHAILRRSELVFPSGAQESEITQAIADLAALGVLVRSGA